MSRSEGDSENRQSNTALETMRLILEMVLQISKTVSISPRTNDFPPRFVLDCNGSKVEPLEWPQVNCFPF